METDGSLAVYILVVAGAANAVAAHAVVVVPGSVETTPFDDAVAHSINQSGAPSSASAVMHPRNFWSVDSGDTADAVCARGKMLNGTPNITKSSSRHTQE